MDILNYLNERQQGRDGLRRNGNHLFIEQLGCMPTRNHLNNTIIDTGNTFACKFSRNNNNLHVIGCSTEHGEIIVQNTMNHFDSPNKQIKQNHVHDNAIFNFAWAEPQMKLVTACGDQTSKLCNLDPSGKLVVETEFNHNSSVRTVMFCPESSDIFCGGGQNSIVKIWDARINNNNSVLHLDHQIPNAHGFYGPNLRNKKLNKMFVISTLIFKNSQSVLSCSPLDNTIKMWDLRKSYCQVKGNTEPLPLIKYTNDKIKSHSCMGYIDMIISPNSTHLYASGTNNVIDCYLLDSIEKSPLCQYSGYFHETSYSKISISNDGRYLFSGCIDESGVIWVTDFPYNEKPMYKMSNSLPRKNKEFSTSDWCADPTCIKLATSSDSMPVLWSILTLEQKELSEMKCSKTSSYKKLILKKKFTAPVKLDYELKEKYKKETEENMKKWDLEEQSLIVPTVDNSQVITKNPWEIFFSKSSPKSCRISPQTDSSRPSHSSPSVSKQIPDAITPTSSKKRKKSMPSPRSLIDHYLVPSNKREKFDPVNEN